MCVCARVIVSVCVGACIFVCTYVCVYVHVHTHACMCACTHKFVCHMYMGVLVHMCIYVCMCAVYACLWTNYSSLRPQILITSMVLSQLAQLQLINRIIITNKTYVQRFPTCNI